MKKSCLLFLFIVCMSIRINAVPAYPGVVVVHQPDGTELSIVIHGDEYFSYTTTDDGYLISKNEDGVYEYATCAGSTVSLTGVKACTSAMRGDAGYGVPSGVPQGNELRAMMQPIVSVTRSKAMNNAPVARYPLKGTPKSLVILVNFSDVKYTVRNAQKEFEQMLNETGYSKNRATSSARDYFIVASDSAFRPYFDVYGPYTLDRPCSYYGEATGSNNDANPRQMVIDACGKANAAGVDLSEYDTDGDGLIDNVFVYYAGHNQAEGGGENTIWPHRSVVSNSPSYEYEKDGKTVSVRISDYSCTSELRGSYGSEMCGIGTFVHEFGHVLGLPDFYITDYKSDHATPGRWDVMDQGPYNNNGRTPPTYSAYERFFLGWLTPEVMEPGLYNLEPLIESNRAFIVSMTEHNLDGRNPNPTEFFMVENRQRIGLDEYGLPGEGLLVQHIRYNPQTWGNNTVNNRADDLGVDVVRADKMTSNTEGDTYPGSNEVHSCYFIMHDGTEIKTPLTSILEDGKNISFKFAGGGEGASNVEIVNSLNRFVSYPDSISPVQTMEISGRKLPSTVTVSASREDDFFFREAGSTDEFKNELVLTPDKEDSSLYAAVEVYMKTDILTYGKSVKSVIKVECDGDKMISAQTEVEMQTLRPVYVVPPMALEAKNVSPYSYLASWKPVYDATCYYLSSYTIKDEPGALVTDFDDFETSVPADWESTFNAVTSTHSASGAAPYFTSGMDTLVSERYIIPVESISFWLNPNNIVNAQFVIEAINDTMSEWMPLQTLDITGTTVGGVQTIKFTDGQQYNRFRFYYIPATSPRGGVAIDDFTVNSSKTLEYNVRRTVVEDTVFMVSNLNPEVNYQYKVQASDKKSSQYGDLLYENITDYSNVIEVKTLESGIPEDLKQKHRDQWIAVSMMADGSGYVAYVKEVLENYNMYIYTINGSLAATVPVTSNEVAIPQLTNGQMYIIKYSSANGIKRKDKYAKLFYNIR